MKPRTEKSLELHKLMVKMGYSEEFAYQITLNLNTDWTAQRMMGYLFNNGFMPEIDVADEMLGILGDRNRIMEKKEMEYVNAKWNEFLARGFGEDDEDYTDEME